MTHENITNDIAAGRAVIEEVFDAADRDEFSEDDLAKVDMLWRAVDELQRAALYAGAFQQEPRTITRDHAMEEAAQLDAAREWLCERADGVPAIYWQQTPHWIRERVSELYPANTPGQDGWSSFCEDWAAGTLAPALHADALDAATGQSRR